MSLPYFNLYPTDFEADTSHLTLEEDGAYNRLLRLMWITPGCSLPDDDAWIMRRIRCDAETFARVVLPVIAEFMKRQGGRVFSPRLMREWKKVDVTSRKRSDAGKKGGRPQHAETKAKDEKPGYDFAKAGLFDTRALPEPEPEPEPEYSVAKATGDGAALNGMGEDFAKQLFDRGVDFLGRHGTKESTARSFVGKLRKAHPDAEIFNAFVACSKAGAVDPIPWITAALVKPKSNQDMLNKVFSDMLKGPTQ